MIIIMIVSRCAGSATQAAAAGSGSDYYDFSPQVFPGRPPHQQEKFPLPCFQFSSMMNMALSSHHACHYSPKFLVVFVICCMMVAISSAQLSNFQTSHGWLFPVTSREVIGVDGSFAMLFDPAVVDYRFMQFDSQYNSSCLNVTALSNSVLVQASPLFNLNMPSACLTMLNVTVRIGGVALPIWHSFPVSVMPLPQDLVELNAMIADVTTIEQFDFSWRAAYARISNTNLSSALDFGLVNSVYGNNIIPLKYGAGRVLLMQNYYWWNRAMRDLPSVSQSAHIFVSNLLKWVTDQNPYHRYRDIAELTDRELQGWCMRQPDEFLENVPITSLYINQSGAAGTDAFMRASPMKSLNFMCRRLNQAAVRLPNTAQTKVRYAPGVDPANVASIPWKSMDLSPKTHGLVVVYHEELDFADIPPLLQYIKDGGSVMFLGFSDWYDDRNAAGASFISNFGYVYDTKREFTQFSYINVTGRLDIVAYFQFLYKRQSSQSTNGLDIRPNGSTPTAPLPLVSYLMGDSVTWATTAAQYIQISTRTVTFPTFSATQGQPLMVNLTATVTSSTSGSVSSYWFTIALYPLPPSTSDTLAYVQTNLAELLNLNTFNTSGDVALPTAGPYGTTLSWSSSDTSKLSSSGVLGTLKFPVPSTTIGSTAAVTPLFLTSKNVTAVTLTATVSFNGQNAQASIPMNVSNMKGFATTRYWRFGGTSLDSVSTTGSANFVQETGFTTFYLSALEYTQTSSSGYLIESLGYLVPNVTGSVKFWCSGDDHMRFYLSSSDSYSSSSLTLMCNRPSWSNFRSYSIASSPVSLVAGQKYFFQLLFADGGSGNHFSLAWADASVSSIPNGYAPIGSQFLLPFPYRYMRNGKSLPVKLTYPVSGAVGPLSLQPFKAAQVSDTNLIASSVDINAPIPVSANVHIATKEIRPPSYNGVLRAFHLPTSPVFGYSPAAQLSFAIVQQPTLGSLTLNSTTGAFSFFPSDAFYVHYAPGPGRDFFTFSVSITVNGNTYKSPMTGSVRLGFEYPLVEGVTYGRYTLPAPPYPAMNPPTQNAVPGDLVVGQVLIGQAYMSPPNWVNQRLIEERHMQVQVVMQSASNAPAPPVKIEIWLVPVNITVVNVMSQYAPNFTCYASGPANVPTYVSASPSFTDSYVAEIPAAWMKTYMQLRISVGSNVYSYTSLPVVPAPVISFVHLDVQHGGIRYFDEMPFHWPWEYLARMPAKAMYGMIFPPLQNDYVPLNTGMVAFRQGMCDESLNRVSAANYTNCQANWGGFPYIASSSFGFPPDLKSANGLNVEGFSWGGNTPATGGGLGGGLHGCGDIGAGILMHECGHGWNLPHSVDDANFPYLSKGNVSTISQYDQLKRRFITYWNTCPTCQTVDFKFDPMQGGDGSQDAGDFFASFSDYNYKIVSNTMMNLKRWDALNASFNSKPSFSVYDSVKNAYAPAADSVSPIVSRFTPVYFISGYIDLPNASDIAQTGWRHTIGNSILRYRGNLIELMPDVRSADARIANNVAKRHFVMTIKYETTSGLIEMQYLLPQISVNEGDSRSPQGYPHRFGFNFPDLGDLVSVKLSACRSIGVLGAANVACQWLADWFNPTALLSTTTMNGNVDTDNIVNSLLLPRTVEGWIVQWESSHPSIISPNIDATTGFAGAVSLPPMYSGPVQVTLVATMTNFGQTKVKSFQVNVQPATATHVSELVQYTADKVCRWILNGQAANQVSSGLNLLTSRNGATLSWSSSVPKAISSSGVVSPARDMSLSIVLQAQISATVGQSSDSTTVQCNVVVPPLNAAAAARIVIFKNVTTVRVVSYGSGFILNTVYAQDFVTSQRASQPFMFYFGVLQYSMGYMLGRGRIFLIGHEVGYFESYPNTIGSQLWKNALRWVTENSTIRFDDVLSNVTSKKLPILNHRASSWHSSWTPYVNVISGTEQQFTASYLPSPEKYPVLFLWRNICNRTFVDSLLKYVRNGGGVVFGAPVWPVWSYSSAECQDGLKYFMAQSNIAIQDVCSECWGSDIIAAAPSVTAEVCVSSNCSTVPTADLTFNQVLPAATANLTASSLSPYLFTLPISSAFWQPMSLFCAGLSHSATIAGDNSNSTGYVVKAFSTDCEPKYYYVRPNSTWTGQVVVSFSAFFSNSSAVSGSIRISVVSPWSPAQPSIAVPDIINPLAISPASSNLVKGANPIMAPNTPILPDEAPYFVPASAQGKLDHLLIVDQVTRPNMLIGTARASIVAAPTQTPSPSPSPSPSPGPSPSPSPSPSPTPGPSPSPSPSPSPTPGPSPSPSPTPGPSPSPSPTPGPSPSPTPTPGPSGPLVPAPTTAPKAVVQQSTLVKVKLTVNANQLASNAFKSEFIANLTFAFASALNIARSRVRITNLTAGSVIADVVIDDDVVQTSASATPLNNTASSSVAAQLLISQISDPQSPLIASSLGSIVDQSYVPPAPVSYTATVFICWDNSVASVSSACPQAPLVPAPTPAPSPASSAGSSTGGIVGGLVAAVLIGAVGYYAFGWWAKRRAAAAAMKAAFSEAELATILAAAPMPAVIKSVDTPLEVFHREDVQVVVHTVPTSNDVVSIPTLPSYAESPPPYSADAPLELPAVANTPSAPAELLPPVITQNNVLFQGDQNM